MSHSSGSVFTLRCGVCVYAFFFFFFMRVRVRPLRHQVRTGNIIQQLADDYLNVQGNATSFTPPASLKCGCEGPTFFKHAKTYFITLGSGCCACKGGCAGVLASCVPLCYRCAANKT
eukprot:SAG11_NODE_9128_length_940_cov_0.956005_2_plen_117_part_00